MKIKFLGSGSAFVLGKENYQSNILLSKDTEVRKKIDTPAGMPGMIQRNIETKHLLYDVGTTIPDALDEAGLKPQDLDSIYISHLHGDHAGGIEYIAFKTYFEVFNFGKTEFGSMRPNLYAHKSILFNGWDKTWRGGLESIQGQTNTLETYFDTEYMSNNDTFEFYGTEIRPIQTVHIVDNRSIVPSYGLMFEDDDKTVFISGDSQFAPNQMLTYFQQSDIIFHDCEFAEYPNSVHAQYRQLLELDSHTRAKMYLYHYMLGSKTYNEVNQMVQEDGFAGLVKKGQEFDTSEI